jgi:hypothetical protein
MKMNIIPLAEGKTKKGGFVYTVLLKDESGQQVMNRFYSSRQYPLNKEVSVDIRFGRDNVYFVA